MEATTTHTTARTINARTLRDQIGGMNVLAISGGRLGYVTESTVELPVSNGYRVLVTLEADDTYTVRRAIKRGGRLVTKGEMFGVYAEQVGEVAYRASCFHSTPFG